MDSYVLVKSAMDKIHKHSYKNREEVLASGKCHCFYCESEFSPSEVVRWTDQNLTAICPRCHVDSVIGDSSGYEMTTSLLHAMHEFWFERKVLPDDFDFSWFSPVKV